MERRLVVDTIALTFIDSSRLPSLREQRRSPDGLLWLAGILAAAWVIHLVASGTEDRAWIHYRRPGGGGGGEAMSNAMAEFEAILSPAAEHRLKGQRSQHVIREENGGDGRRRPDNHDRNR